MGPDHDEGGARSLRAADDRLGRRAPHEPPPRVDASASGPCDQRLETALGEDGQAVLALVHNRRADAVSPLLARVSPSIHAALDRLSPLPVMSRLRGRALIAHGRADISIPYTESLRLARAAGAHAVILNTFHHTGPLSLLDLVGSGALDAWRLVSLADALLRAREP